MPSSTRRARERADLRDRILETAVGVLETEGVAALTMRRVATDMEYTAPVIYQHFANKDALLQEIVAHGHRAMATELEHALGQADVDRRMLESAEAYVHFAGDHPHLYAVMNGTAVGGEERRALAEPAHDLLRDMLTAWSGHHAVDLGDLSDACEIVWGTLHGMASLGVLDTVGNERARRLAVQALSAILHGWRSAAPGA
ncbi:TetR/AcrR family transcriptional regulator [Patulibacter americanus]|uniref:TetR/AcrR family transcriptional regulator n=1 Tax=Patulibacter americanus TaxID=588672 RepID=UPI0003B4A98F|nr:TetR/AcrR family transcriptional regulator [Patulibacter americanus]